MGGGEVLVLKLSLVSACISFTVAEAAVFKGVREWIKKRSAFLGKLVSCFFCLGFWVSFALVARVQPTLYPVLSYVADFVLTGLTVAWLSGMMGAVMCALLKYGDK